MSQTYGFLKYAIDCQGKYYFIAGATGYKTRKEMQNAAKAHSVDIPCCHTGPLLYVFKIPENIPLNEHLKGIASVLLRVVIGY
jgi:hypothetical protein